MQRNEELSSYRLEQAEQCLQSAQLLAQAGDYRGAANRSYYSVFHTMRGLLALQGKDFKKHSGVIAEFRRAYIKTGLLNESLSQTLTILFRVRTECDYDDFYLIDKQEVLEQLRLAEHFLQEVRRYLSAIAHKGEL